MQIASPLQSRCRRRVTALNVTSARDENFKLFAAAGLGTFPSDVTNGSRTQNIRKLQ